MAIIKCKMCGGDLALTEGQFVAECEYCGSRQTVPSADNEKKLNLFARGDRLRSACEFDKASGVYESIIADFPEEAEAYWGLVLCKYGIEYVDDPATGKKIPTCHRSSYDSVLDDGDFAQVMLNGDPVSRRVYLEEAKQIDEICRKIVAVSAKEAPYDIFICYKESDENGDRTLDSVLAQDIYDALTEKRYRVFFSRISLEDKIGQEYEPYIFSALNSAKIMLAVGTSYEHYNAVWVKNEWSRFLKMMSRGEKKYLIPCYKGIDAYDMPREFAKLQAQDLGKVGAMQDLLRGIEKILPCRTKQMKETVARQWTSGGDPAPLLKRAFMFLEDGNWRSADEYCEKVLDIDPECAEAYLGKLMAQLHVQKQDGLRNVEKPFDVSINYQKVMRFGDSKLRNLLESCTEQIKARNEKERIAREKRAEQEYIVRKKREEEERKRAEEERLIREKREAEERLIREKRKQEQLAQERIKEEALEKLASIRQKFKPVQKLIASGYDHTAGLKADGTVVAVGIDKSGRCNVTDWCDIVAIAAGSDTMGLRSNGTVVATGDDVTGCRHNMANAVERVLSYDYLYANATDWRDIIDIAAGSHSVGLRSNGTVVAGGYNKFGQCRVSGWRDIVAIAAGNYHTLGVKADGTVVAVGNNEHGQCNVAGWRNVVAVAGGYGHTVGLKADGTVVAVGDNKHGQCSVTGWRDIVAISAGNSHTVGLKADGTVVATGENANKVTAWRNIVAIAAASYTNIVGLKADGTLVAVGSNLDGQCNVTGWRLFRDFQNLETERKIARQQMQAARERMLQQAGWRNVGRCQHCGGELKGFLSKKCVSCGKPKDY